MEVPVTFLPNPEDLDIMLHNSSNRLHSPHHLSPHHLSPHHLSPHRLPLLTGVLTLFLLLPGSTGAQNLEETPTAQEAEAQEEEAQEEEAQEEEAQEEETPASQEESPRATAYNLTRSVASDRRPAFSPDGSLIAFESNRDGNWELYVMDRDGQNQRRITIHPASDRSASFSPDGKSLLFQSNRAVEGRASDIFQITLDPLAPPVRLTDHEADDAFPRYSPDGTKILFTSSRHGNADIFLMNADGSEPTRLTDHEANDAWATWSGDGQRIAFFSRRDGNDEVYSMNIDGSDLERLTDHEANDFVPFFDPSRNRLVFASNRRGQNRTQLYFLEPGKDELQLELREPGRATEPVFSSDGRFLAFVTNRDENNEIYLLDLEGDGSPP